MDVLILPILLIGFVYFAMIAPQRRKMKAHRELMASLQIGDEVVTNAGIYGAVAEVEGSVIWIEVAPEVELKIQKSAVVQKITQEEATADDAVDVGEETDDVG
ncbi:MAG: preprotein translocase subunit YajC [Acidimicrobiia bacterium]|nr:preprotein translocase subunit YajC [Acidimicrobiia bacterium]MCY4456521.1 preprotein translocase subunit YajC [Acidimicrobiaceae bacterium]